MIKSEIRSLITNLLPKWDKTAKYAPRVVDATIERVLGELYNESFRMSPFSLQSYTRGYGYVTPLVVSTYNSIYYTILPDKIIPFPDKASGVRRVSTALQTGFTFFPMDSRESDLILSGSYSNGVTDKIGYALIQSNDVAPASYRVEYYNMTAAIAAVGVRMDLVVPFSSYLDTDNVLIPEIPDQEGKTFTDRVLEILGVVRPVDTLDDNSDVLQQQNNKG
jgi:hypothetical protein